MAFQNETFIQQIIDVIREDVLNSDFYKEMSQLPKSLTSEQKLVELQKILETQYIDSILPPFINMIQKLSLDEIQQLLLSTNDLYEDSTDDDGNLLGINTNNLNAIKKLCLFQIDSKKKLLQEPLKNQPSQGTFNNILNKINTMNDFEFETFETAYEQLNIGNIKEDENSIENINKLIDFYDMAAEHIKQQIIDSSIDKFIRIYRNSVIFKLSNIISIYNNTNDENLHEIKQIIIETQKQKELSLYDYKYKNSFIIIDTSLDYYSAYSNNISTLDFANKNMVWFTKSLDQSILHPLDSNVVTNPVLFKFKLARSISVLFNFNIDNNNIFDFISPNIKTKFNELLTCIETRNLKDDGSESITPEIFLFNISNNKNILYVIEAINRIFCGTFYFDGYRNLMDQDEIAVIHFYDIINSSNLDKFNYINIYHKDPSKSNDIIQNINLPSKGVKVGAFYHMMKRIYSMKCKELEELKIKYENDTTKEKYIFDCHDKRTHSAPYLYQDPIQAKYLKYKQKYLKLKAKLL